MIKVIIAEDEAFLRKGMILTTPWNNYGCQVVGEADNGLEGLKLIQRLNPDIVITDIKMPGLNGIQMMEQIGSVIDTEFIITTGYSDFEFAKSAIDLGAQGYLLKPIDDSEFEAVMKKAIEAVKVKQTYKMSLSSRSNHVIQFIENFSFNEEVTTNDRYLNIAIEYIQENYYKNISIKDISDHLQISAGYLSKLFKDETSYTFLEYYTNYRLKKAIEYLKDNKIKIYEVAHKVGYEDSRYFSTLFRKIVGITPTEFRNMT